MQHYGAPTRLLDWTLSPWVAAYFAVSDLQDDGEIWAFNQAQLIKQYFARSSMTKDRYNQFEKLISSQTVEDWLNAALEQSPVISMFRYQYANRQMSAQ